MLFKVITTIAVTVAVFILAAQTPNPSRGRSDGIAIPLTRRSDTDAREFHATSHNTKIIRGPSGIDGSDRNEGTPHPSAVQRDGQGAGVSLTPYMDRIWYGTISIGTPPKSFTVQLNSGFSDIFVPASTGDENCRSHTDLWYLPSHITNLTFNTSPTSAVTSPTNVDLNLDFSIGFKDGRTARGNQYADNVTIGGFTADVQTIGAATTYSSNMGASQFPPDGILGLAFPSLSKFYGQSPLFHTLFNTGKLSQPVFSLMLTDSGGELYVGGTNEALYIHSTLVFTPVTNLAMARGLWSLTIDTIKVNGVTVLTDVSAIIDTGSNYILGDPQRVLAVHKAARGKPYEGGGGGYYTFPCSDFPSMTFTIGGRSFFIPSSALKKGQVEFGSHDCFSAIASVEILETLNYWSIGTSFLKEVYTVFDFNSESPRIGFAQLPINL